MGVMKLSELCLSDLITKEYELYREVEMVLFVYEESQYYVSFSLVFSEAFLFI